VLQGAGGLPDVDPPGDVGLDLSSFAWPFWLASAALALEGVEAAEDGSETSQNGAEDKRFRKPAPGA